MKPMYWGRGALGVLLAALLTVFATTAQAAEKILNRDVLALYDSTQEKRVEETRIYRWLEMPLNHLGYRLTFHDVAKGLPDPAAARRYHAIATWFNEKVPDARAYLTWAARLARNGPRFVVFDNVGTLGDKSELPYINAFLNELGLAYADFYVGDSTATGIRVSRFSHHRFRTQNRRHETAGSPGRRSQVEGGRRTSHALRTPLTNGRRSRMRCP